MFELGNIKHMVVLKVLNDDEVRDMAMLTKTFDMHVRFIEYMPIGVLGTGIPFETLSVSDIRSRIEGCLLLADSSFKMAMEISHEQKNR